LPNLANYDGWAIGATFYQASHTSDLVGFCMEFDMSCVYLVSGFDDSAGNAGGSVLNRNIQYRLMGKNGYYGGYGKVVNVDYTQTGQSFSSTSPSYLEVGTDAIPNLGTRAAGAGEGYGFHKTMFGLSAHVISKGLFTYRFQ